MQKLSFLREEILFRSITEDGKVWCETHSFDELLLENGRYKGNLRIERKSIETFEVDYGWKEMKDDENTTK